LSLRQSTYLVIGAGALAATLLAGCSTASSGGGGDIATVNGEPVTRTAFVDQLESLPQAKAVLNQLIQGKLIDQYAKDHKIDVTDAELKAKEDEIRARYPAGQFDQILKSQNISQDQLHKILRQQIIVEKAVAPDIKISDADIKNYLAQNHLALDTQAQVQARHILVRDPATANMVEAKLKGGMKFEDAAKQYSQDPGSKDKGGELGFFTKTQMVAPFADAAFSQEVGVVGPPVKSPFGYHIIQVESKKPAQIATLENSKAKITGIIKQQQESTRVPVFLNDLRNKAKIEVADDKLKDVAAPIPTPAPPVSSQPLSSQPATGK
jgi:foldase protein PrsA